MSCAPPATACWGWPSCCCGSDRRGECPGTGRPERVPHPSRARMASAPHAYGIRMACVWHPSRHVTADGSRPIATTGPGALTGEHGTLPVDAVLPRLLAALAAGPAAVLSAPPGAGKTTRVPLALLGAPWLAGRLLMLEPRRIAARAAAERLAAGLGEPVGRSVGYRIRGESRPGARIEVVTEGILTRMLQSDPDLPGVGAILFDEVHERSIHSDLGLALALEVQEALRPELRLVAMSATLDVAGFARLMRDAPVIESAGRLHPVETRWLERPWRRPAGRPGPGSRRGPARASRRRGGADRSGGRGNRRGRRAGRRAGLFARRRRDRPGGGAAARRAFRAGDRRAARLAALRAAAGGAGSTRGRARAGSCSRPRSPRPR